MGKVKICGDNFLPPGSFLFSHLRNGTKKTEKEKKRISTVKLHTKRNLYKDKKQHTEKLCLYFLSTSFLSLGCLGINNKQGSPKASLDITSDSGGGHS